MPSFVGFPKAQREDLQGIGLSCLNEGRREPRAPYIGSALRKWPSTAASKVQFRFGTSFENNEVQFVQF
jgi:hypothetical protein